MKASGTRTILLLCACAVLAIPSTASAEEPAGKHGIHKTATNLVDQVMVAIDAVRHKPSEASAEEESEDADDARAREATDRGVVPYARTVYDLLRGKFELGGQQEGEEADDGDGGSSSPVFLQVKPKSRGGYLRCEVRF